MLSISANISIPDAELKFTFARSSGPGGQNVNKVNSKAILHWNMNDSPSLPFDVRQRFIQKFGNRLTKEGEIVIHSQQYRDQPKNEEDCLNKLRQMIESVLVAPKKRRPTKPSKASKFKRLESKKTQSQKKQNRRTVRDD